MSIAIMKETTGVKLDKEAKEKAKKVFKELGITMGDAFNMFLHQVNLHNGIPFDVKIPNDKTKSIIEEARKGENIEDFSFEELKHKNENQEATEKPTFFFELFHNANGFVLFHFSRIE